MDPATPLHWLMRRPELLGHAASLAGSLHDLGIGQGDVLAVLEISPERITGLCYAALLLGAVPFLLDPEMGSERRNSLLAEAGCRHICSEAGVESLPPGIRRLPVPMPVARNLSDQGSVPSRQTSWDEIQLILATSGSSGEPRGVMLSARSIGEAVVASRHRLGLEKSDCWLNCLPRYHIGGAIILYRCLESGARMLLHSGFNPQRVWQDLKRGVTHISLVPVMLSRLLNYNRDASPPHSLRRVLVGGGPLSPALAQRAAAAGWPLCVSYGMSETASQVATDCSRGAGSRAGDVGLPLAGYRVRIAENGGIQVSGGGLMAGYLNPELEPGLGLKDGWFDTGDLGELDRTGRLRLKGRADDRLVSAGRSIHPLEVETLLADCPGVDQVAVAGLADATWGDLLVAVFTGPAEPSQVEHWCRQALPGSRRPCRFLRVEQLPLIGPGKIDRRNLALIVQDVYSAQWSE